MGRRGVGRSARLRVTVGTIAFAFCITALAINTALVIMKKR